MGSSRVIEGYRVDRPLGAGGMGSVYAAEKLATHQAFAVKFIQEHLLEDPSCVARFEREIGALRRIRHPNVVDVFEWSVPREGAKTAPYLVMELLEGEGLDRLLKRTPVLPPSVAVQIILQVLDGLAAAHAVGVLHRDLGPTNVFLEAQPSGTFRVKLLDFGLARAVGDEGGVNVTQEGTLLGKPAYVAPEQFVGRPVDVRSDIFGAGIILYRMLAGRFPYKEAQSQLLWVERYAERQDSREYPPPRTARPALPASLDAVVQRAIRKNPDERFASAREMQQALLSVEDDILDSTETVLITPQERGPIEAGSSTVVGRSAVSLAGRPSRTPYWIAGAIIAASLVAAGVLFLASRSSGGRATTAAAPHTADAAGLPAPDVPAPPTATREAEKVHLVILGAPPGSVVTVGSAALAEDPADPEVRQGDIPRSAKPIDVVVAAQGFETWRDAVVPDRHRTLRVSLRPIAAPDAGAGEASAGPDAGRGPPAARDGGRPRADVRHLPPPAADAAAPPPPPPRDARPAARPDVSFAPPRDAGPGVRVPVDGASRLPEDPFAGARGASGASGR